jgi:hypothetical protein
MLNDDQKEYLKSILEQAQYSYTTYEKETTGEFLEGYKRSLKTAKEIFESCLDIGQDDPWFVKGWSAINHELAIFEKLNREVPAEQTTKETALNQEVFAYSERAMNKTVVPISKAIREIRFPVDLEINGEKYSTTNCWEARHFMTMDALAYLIIKKLGFPRKAQTIFDSVEEIEKRAELLKLEDVVTEHKLEENLVSSFKNTKYWVKFEAEFFREFTGKQLETQQITDLLAETACKFTFSYPVLLKDENKKITEKKYRVSVHTSFFTLAYIDALDKNDKSKKRTFYAFFNTGLGECFVNNLLAKGYDMFNTQKFYSLPSLAQMFFRKFIVHHSHFGPIHKPLEAIRKGLNLTIKGDSDLIAYLKQKVFNPLKENGGISDFQVKKELGGWWICFQRSDRKYQIYQQHLKVSGRKKTESKDKTLKSKQFQSDEMVKVNGVKRWPEETDEY